MVSEAATLRSGTQPAAGDTSFWFTYTTCITDPSKVLIRRTSGSSVGYVPSLLSNIPRGQKQDVINFTTTPSRYLKLNGVAWRFSGYENNVPDVTGDNLRSKDR